MDGILFATDRVIAGAVEAVHFIQSKRIPHLFVTNATSLARAGLREKLNCMGIPAEMGEILTPAAAAAEWLRANGTGDIALFVRPEARQEFQDLPLGADDAERGAAYVVIGDLGEAWDYSTLNRAFRLLHHNPQAKLIALGMTRYWLAPTGFLLDVAPFAVALECATGRKAKVFGKPAAPFYHAACERLRIPPGQVLMIGDDVVTDVGGAQAAGLWGALVKTGKWEPADLKRSIRPDLVLDSMADLPRWWNEKAL
jgi:HAD superfamily hydrolase (TIGR01458 family)